MGNWGYSDRYDPSQRKPKPPQGTEPSLPHEPGAGIERLRGRKDLHAQCGVDFPDLRSKPFMLPQEGGFEAPRDREVPRIHEKHSFHHEHGPRSHMPRHHDERNLRPTTSRPDLSLLATKPSRLHHHESRSRMADNTTHDGAPPEPSLPPHHGEHYKVPFSDFQQPVKPRKSSHIMADNHLDQVHPKHDDATAYTAALNTGSRSTTKPHIMDENYELEDFHGRNDFSDDRENGDDGRDAERRDRIREHNRKIALARLRGDVLQNDEERRRISDEQKLEGAMDRGRQAHEENGKENHRTSDESKLAHSEYHRKHADTLKMTSERRMSG